MTTKVRVPQDGPRRRGARLLAVAATLLAAGCERSTPQALPPTTTPPGQVTFPTTPAEPARADERRPQRTSFLVRAEGTTPPAGSGGTTQPACERLAEAVRPAALEAVGPFGFSGGVGGFRNEARVTAGPMAAAEGDSSSAPAQAPAPTAPREGVDFSGTNVQEAGVDEPDLVKTDGRLLVSTVGGRLRVLDVSGAPRQIGVLAIPRGAGDLLLVGTRALVVSNTGRSGSDPGSESSSSPLPYSEGRPKTTITVVDLADPAKPSIARTHTIDGAYVDARLVGGVARIVTRSQPDISFPERSPDSQAAIDQAQAANREIVRKASPASFLPKGASCGDAYLPVEPAGVGTVAVQSLDPTADAPGPAVTVVADASTVYASAGRLFVATNRSGNGDPVRLTTASPRVVESGRTAIHAFDITDPAKARYAGSGDVPGRLLNQFSLSEDAGVLRVATTLDAMTSGDQSHSRVSVLRPAGEEWVETGAVDGLGKGERIYAVRFMGTTGYVVTFRQVDPLYVLDLRDVRAPKVTGELKITGYSAYLHPAGDGRLLGIGQEATDQGRRVGTQLSLFDVGNPAAPTKLAGAVLSTATSSAERDHHAFLFWPATGLVVAPVQSYGGGDGPLPTRNGAQIQGFVGAVAFRVGDKTVTEAGRITHPGSIPIQRSLVVGDRLLTLSRVGVAANDLKSMGDAGFLAF